MRASVPGIAAATATIPVHVLLVLADGAVGLALLVYIGVVLPAVWSGKPARRRAAAAVLRQILDVSTRSKRR
jgi:hypothetical protein